MGLMEAQREVTGMVHSGTPFERLATKRIRTAPAVARQWSGPSANRLAIGRPDDPLTLSPGGGDGATLPCVRWSACPRLLRPGFAPTRFFTTQFVKTPLDAGARSIRGIFQAVAQSINRKTYLQHFGIHSATLTE
jgi:hypothetical protein